MTFSTYKMIMLFIAIRLFILCKITPELVFADKVALYQKIKSIIYCSPADTVIFIFHAYIECLYIEMIILGIYFFKNSISFRCFPQTFIFEVSSKDFLYLIVYLLIYRHFFSLQSHKYNKDNLSHVLFEIFKPRYFYDTFYLFELFNQKVQMACMIYIEHDLTLKYA